MKIRRLKYVFALLALMLGGGRLCASADLRCGADTLSRSSLADSVALLYWDWVDLSDSTLYLASGGEESFSAMENYCSEFFSLLAACSPSGAQKAVGALMDKAAVARRYDYFMTVAEKYFYSLQSPYYNERLLLLFLWHKIGRTDIPEVEKSREKYLEAEVRRNMPGTQALDFNLEGGGSLYKVLGACTERQTLMLVFFDAGCRDCLNGISRLGHSPAVGQKIAAGELAVLAVCTEGKLSSVSYMIPSGWIAASDNGAVLQNSLYRTLNTPSVYFIERDGTVALKDVSASAAIEYLLGLR